MSIRRRLTLSYIVMLVVPVILSILTIAMYGSFFAKDVHNDKTVKLLHSTVQGISDTGMGGVFRDIKHDTDTNSDSFKNIEHDFDIDQRLASIDMGLIVRKDSKIIYTSSMIDSALNPSLLPSYGSDDRDGRKFVPLKGNINVMQQHDISFSDGSKGSIFIITDAAMAKKFGKYMTYSILTILAILVLTNIVLTLVVSKSIINPLETLKAAALEIKNGNLDFEIKSISKDEIGEVCSAFEDARHRLKESDELKLQYENNRKELIANISHDLKTPITAIKGYVEGIKDGVADTPEKLDRYVNTIYNKTVYLDKLIDELFIFSKLDLNKMSFNFEEIDMEKYLMDCSEELQFDLEEQGISLKYTESRKMDSPLIVQGDREKLKRVIMNIVGNSIKYMDKDYGIIEILLKDKGNTAEIEIKDNGRGIPEENISMIFNKFYRAEPSRNTLTGGSGLGLAISKLIIEEHGGRIWAESKLNTSTSIHFTLKKIEYKA